MSSPPYKSTQPFDGCKEGKSLRLQPKPDSFHLHLVGCSQCEAAQQDVVEYKSLIQRAKRALNEAQPIPNDTSWAHFKTRLDAKLSEEKSQAWWVSWRLVAAVLCLLLVGVGAWLTLPQRLAPLHPHPVVALRVLERPDKAPSFENFLADRTFLVFEKGSPLVLAEGQTLKASEHARALSIDHRHHIILSSHSEIELLSLGMKGVSLALKQGDAYFEVTRTDGEGVFQVKALEHTVEVIGTMFHVELDSAKASATISVSEGKVRVISQGDLVPQMITAGSSLRIGEPISNSEPSFSEEIKSQTTRETHVSNRSEVIKLPASTQPVSASSKETETLVEGFKLARLGRCVQALNTIREPLTSKHAATAREALWLAAYCQRRLGNLERSQQMFNQYGTRGPLPFPEGNSLPPLP